MPARFVTMKQVVEELGLSEAQVHPLVRSKDLPAVIGGPPVAYRTGPPQEWIQRLYRATERFIDEHTFTGTSNKRTSEPPP